MVISIKTVDAVARQLSGLYQSLTYLVFFPPEWYFFFLFCCLAWKTMLTSFSVSFPFSQFPFQVFSSQYVSWLFLFFSIFLCVNMFSGCFCFFFSLNMFPGSFCSCFFRRQCVFWLFLLSFFLFLFFSVCFLAVCALLLVLPDLAPILYVSGCAAVASSPLLSRFSFFALNACHSPVSTFLVFLSASLFLNFSHSF